MNSMYLSIVNQLDNGIIIIDEDLQIIFWNDWLTSYCGKSAKEVQGTLIIEALPRLDKEIYTYMFKKALNRGQASFCSAAMHEYFIAHGCEKAKQPRQNMLIRPLSFEGCQYIMLEIHDISNQYERIRKLNDSLQKTSEREQLFKQFAYYDSLTGLPNRKLISDRITQLTSSSDSVFSIFFMDLNDFKFVNDRYGHASGDELLQQFAERLRQVVKQTDIFARIGGDEFLLLIENVNSEADINEYINSIQQVMQAPFTLREDILLHVTPSIGFACYPKHGTTSLELIEEADRRMYEQKRQAKNQ